MVRPVTIPFMLNILPSYFSKAACATALALLVACSPKYDWREVHGNGAPYLIMLPAKPASHARPVNLDGLQVTMTMTAAEVDGVTFAVGTAELPDPAQAQKALQSMKTALVNNIGGRIKQEKATPNASAPDTIDIEASGPAGPDGDARLLMGRFIAKNKRIYQVIVVGKEKNVSREATDTFFNSFKAG